MTDETNRATITALRQALENKQWSAVKKCLGGVQTKLPPHATGTEIARALDTVREAADAFAEVCSFRTAFETAYNARRGLLRAGVCEWAVATLDGFRVFVPVIERVATVVGLLGTGVDERSHVGQSGAVDLLTALWHKHPRCLELVSALGSLCAGHIDNVSRTMRQRGLVVAMQVLKDPENVDNHQLVERTLLYIGLCAICTPDNQQEGVAMVPVLLDVLERLTKAGLPQIAEHAISAFGNISDCWLKENYGYAITNHKSLIAVIVNSWSAFPRSRNMGSCASHTLLSLLSTNACARDAIDDESKTLLNIIDGCRHKSTTLQSLHDIVNERHLVVVSGDANEPTSPPTRSIRARTVVSHDEDDSEDNSPIQRYRKRKRETHKTTKPLDLGTFVSPTRTTRSQKTPYGEGHEIVPVIAKRSRGRPTGSRIVSEDHDGDTTPAPVKRRRTTAKRSLASLEVPSCGQRSVAPKAGPQIIDLCSDSDDEVPSPVGPRELALRVDITPSRRRRASRK